MADGHIRYTIGFDADTTQLRQSLNQAMEQLTNLGKTSQISSVLQEASTEALDLANNLRMAFNQDTGQLDLYKLNSNLQTSGKNLDYYYNKLVQLGPAGQEAFMNIAYAITQTALPIRQANTALDKLWVTMQNTMRWQLTSSVLHGFMGAISTAYGYAKDLNESLNSIQIVTGKSAEQMAQLAKNANEAAMRLSTTTTRYTDSSLIYYQQGKP